MRFTPARLLRSALWRTGKASQTLAARIPGAPLEAAPPAAPAPELLEAKIDPVEILEDEGGWVTCRIDDLIWRLDPTQCIDQDLLDDGKFEAASTRWVQQIVEPGMVAVDVGANFGYYTLHLSRLVAAAGKVYAFEPSVRYRERLNDHLERNNCRNVVVLDYGLSDHLHEEPLYGDNITATMHWLDDSRPPMLEETIRLRTLDSFVDEAGLSRLDFMKVDIDGHEPSFLAGATQTLRRFRPVILMEFSQVSLVMADWDVERLAKQLTDLGYSLHSERTGEAYPSRLDFLVEAMNCSHSVNVLCYPTQVDRRVPGT